MVWTSFNIGAGGTTELSVCDYSADPEMRLARRRSRDGVTSIVRYLETVIAVRRAAAAPTHPRATKAAVRLLQTPIELDLVYCSARPVPVLWNGGIPFVLFDLAGARQSP
jgi:hypothetical protein